MCHVVMWGMRGMGGGKLARGGVERLVRVEGRLKVGCTVHYSSLTECLAPSAQHTPAPSTPACSIAHCCTVDPPSRLGQTDWDTPISHIFHAPLRPKCPTASTTAPPLPHHQHQYFYHLHSHTPLYPPLSPPMLMTARMHQLHRPISACLPLYHIVCHASVPQASAVGGLRVQE